MKALIKLTCSTLLSLGLLGCLGKDKDKEEENTEKAVIEFSITAPAELEIDEQTLGAVTAEINSNSSAELSASWSIQSAPSGFSMALIGGELVNGQSKVEFETPNVSEDTSLVLRLHYSAPETEDYLGQAKYHDVAMTIKAVAPAVDLNLANNYYVNDAVHFLHEGGIGEVIDRDQVRTALTWTSTETNITINYSGQGLLEESTGNQVRAIKTSDWRLLDDNTFEFQIKSSGVSYNELGAVIAEYTHTSEAIISKAIDFDLLPPEQTFSDLAVILPYQQDVWTGES